MNFIKENHGNIVVIVLLAIALIIAIISYRKTKGRCAYCKLSSRCPIKNVKKD